MTSEDQIISLWRQGHNTHEIANRISAISGKPIRENEVHKIIIAERNERKSRLGFTTINGGRNAANSQANR